MKFIEYRKIWFGISGVFIILGMIFLAFNGLNLGIDFAGGTIININLHQTFEVSEIREIIDSFDKAADITYSGEERQEVIIQTQESFTKEQREEIFSLFQEKYDLEDKDLLSIEQVEPAIGGELKRQVFIALSVAIVAMLIYIAFRFELAFGFAAIIALTHDLLVVLAFYAIAGIQVNAPFIAAMLTILGYSINDTIVIFDRIRENRKKFKKNDYINLINTSITQSLSRTINTSVTSLITITALYILGVEAIRSFALPLIVGFVAGTYSSIFIASPIWYLLKTRKTSTRTT
ncbi:MAG TPA: protein translocase subunit SecF [Eubacteriaceae bacterium]|nr:protein translocase subunit SecF [Eubacteriaceae bacterium]